MVPPHLHWLFEEAVALRTRLEEHKLQGSKLLLSMTMWTMVFWLQWQETEQV